MRRCGTMTNAHVDMSKRSICHHRQAMMQLTQRAKHWTKETQTPFCVPSYAHGLQWGTWHIDANGARFELNLPHTVADEYVDFVTQYLHIGDSRICGAGKGVFANVSIPPGFEVPYFGTVYPFEEVSPEGGSTYWMHDGDVGLIDGRPITDMPSAIYTTSFINEPACPAEATPAQCAAYRKAMANVDVRWGDHHRWAAGTPATLYTTRRIHVGQEVLLDYGDGYERNYY